MEQIKLHEKRFFALIKTKVRCVYLEMTTQIEENPLETQKIPQATENPTAVLTCYFCKTEFSDVVKQREHYKLDWHRYNLKRSISGREPLTEEQFLERNGKC